MRRLHDRTFLVAASACVLLVAFLFFAFVYPQVPARLARPSADLIPRFGLWSSAVSIGLPVPESRAALAGSIAVASGLAFVAWGLAVFLAWDRPGGRRSSYLVVAAAIAFFLVAAMALPNYNSDIYNYIATGRVAAAHEANPYSAPVDRFKHDSIYRYASHRYTGIPGDRKLAGWTLVDTALARLSGANVVTSLLVYRLAFLAFNVANVLLVGLILGWTFPRRRLAGMIAYGWNPIVAVGGQSKVDTVMVFFLLIALAAIVRHRTRAAAVPLALSVAVKLLTLPLAALLLVREAAARRWRELAIIAGLLVATLALVYLPFLGAHGLLSREVGLLRGEGATIGGPARAILSLGFAALVVWLGVRASEDRPPLLVAWCLVTLYFAVFLTTIDFAWYLMVLIALTSVAADWRLLVASGVVCLPAFALNGWMSASGGGLPLGSSGAAFALYLVPLALTALVAMAWRRRAAPHVAS